jgi:putative phosphoribosyl transferase
MQQLPLQSDALSFRAGTETPVRLYMENAMLAGDLYVPEHAMGLVVFAHGSGSSRFSPRNRFVASALNEAHLGTFLVDLLTSEEETADAATGFFRFDIPRLAERLVQIAEWAETQEDLAKLPLGFFGASTGAGAALIAAARKPDLVRAVVSRGGRPDLAGPYLENVMAPTLLIVGGLDFPVIDMNRDAEEKMRCATELKIIPNAGHLFEENGTLDEVSRLAQDWFRQYFR